MKIIKIIHISLISFVAFAPIKNIKTKFINLENILSKENIDPKRDLILFSTSILLKLPERKKNKKLPKEYERKKTIKYTPTPLPLKAPENVNIINNLFKKYAYFFLLHKGFYENITYFSEAIKNKDKLFLPVKMYSKGNNSTRDPVLIGGILYGNFIREDILIFLLGVYKKIQFKKVLLITYGEPHFTCFDAHQEIIIITIED